MGKKKKIEQAAAVDLQEALGNGKVELIGSLHGGNVTPIDGAPFEGVMAIPVGFRNEGESDNEVAIRYLDHLDAQDAFNRADAWARSPAGTPYEAAPDLSVDILKHVGAMHV